MTSRSKKIPFPGRPAVGDGRDAVLTVEKVAADALVALSRPAIAGLIDSWKELVRHKAVNVRQRPLLFTAPGDDPGAAATVSGMTMAGLRATLLSSGQGTPRMLDNMHMAAGKRLPWVMHLGAGALDKGMRSHLSGHENYHCASETGLFQLFAASPGEVADFSLIARRIAELSLNPGMVAQDAFLTTHGTESLLFPEDELVRRYLGSPLDRIAAPTPAQKMIFGEQRRRVPLSWNVDEAAQTGSVANQDTFMQHVVAQRPFFFDHVAGLSDQAFREFGELTGRFYGRLQAFEADRADYLLVAQGSITGLLRAVARDWGRHRRLRVGVVNLTMFRPFPADILSRLLRGRKGVTVLERMDQPLAGDLPMMREIRGVVNRALENGSRGRGLPVPWAGVEPWKKLREAPPLYSASGGFGGREPRTGDIVAALENMLPGGEGRRVYYCGVEFVKKKQLTPKQEIWHQELSDQYPGVEELSLPPAPPRDVHPPGSLRLCIRSNGGTGAINAGRVLAGLLGEESGRFVKAGPEYSVAIKGEPTSFYLTAAPEPPRTGCTGGPLDAVIYIGSVFAPPADLLDGLQSGGLLLLGSPGTDGPAIWRQIPLSCREQIRRLKLELWHVNLTRARGMALFQTGAFFRTLAEDEKLPPVFAGNPDQALLEEGFAGARQLSYQDAAYNDAPEKASLPTIPESLKQLPAPGRTPAGLHRFWEQTGCEYKRSGAGSLPAEPLAAYGMVPSMSGVFRNLTPNRYQHPRWQPEKCTGCGDCWTLCPDAAIPGLVAEVGAILSTAVRRLRRRGFDPQHLSRGLRRLETILQPRLLAAGPGADVNAVIRAGVEEHQQKVLAAGGEEAEQTALEFGWLEEELLALPMATTGTFFKDGGRGKKGGLLTLGLNPDTCKGCMACVEACPEGALDVVAQTSTSVAALRQARQFYLDLPPTPERFITALGQHLDPDGPSLQAMLLDKTLQTSGVTGGDSACAGCGEKTPVSLFMTTVAALMQPRVKKYLEKIDRLIVDLGKLLRERIVDGAGLGNEEVLDRFLAEAGSTDLTAGSLLQGLEARQETPLLDQPWLKKVTSLIIELQDLRDRYRQGNHGRGRAPLGLANAGGCSSVWGGTYPYNPWPWPWAHDGDQQAPSLAMGLFEGHMARMAEGFRVVRAAELVAGGRWQGEADESRLASLQWQEFTDDELALCPPVICLGGDGAMGEGGLQSLSHALMAGKPLKMLIVDNQGHSATRDLSEATGFMPAGTGASWTRKEIGLIAAAHRTAFVHQTSVASLPHMLDGFMRGLRSPRPAVFNVYAACQTSHGLAAHASTTQARLALESRAFPFFTFDPDAGSDSMTCFRLDGNPAPDQPWPVYRITVTENGETREVEQPVTFADFAATEPRFAAHFTRLAGDEEPDGLMPLGDYLRIGPGERQGRRPYLWSGEGDQMERLLISAAMVAATEERAALWAHLREKVRPAAQPEVTTDAPPDENRIREQLAGEFTSRLLELALEGELATMAAAGPVPDPTPRPPV